MSKSSANESFARLVQTRLQDVGYYAGKVDGWAGPLTVSAYRSFTGRDAAPAPPVVVPVVSFPGMSELPEPAASYRLPRETTAALTAFYSSPAKSPPYLDWFSFPHDGTRLYSRTGTPLQDRAGDERLDHRCHRLLIGRLTAALAEIYVTLGRAEYERQGWHIYGGCHDYRNKTGGSSLSIHSWGVGIDVNPGENPYAATRTTFSATAIDVMERWGFLSGGRAWGKDWMHFQAAIPNLSGGSYYARNGLPGNIVVA